MNEKKISIIIATYNAGKTLERCLKSIVYQKTSEVELVIVDGKSTDNTLTVADKYRQIIDLLVSERDDGLYDAWNKGIKLCHGKWVMFLGADDLYKSDALLFYLNMLNTGGYDNYDLITGKCELLDNRGKVVRVFGNPYRWNEFRRYMKISHGSTLHNRKLFDELGEFNTNIRICADYEFLLRKRMKSYHTDKIILQMQFGGLSNTPAAFVDAFNIRKMRNSISPLLNVYYFIKGLVGFYIRQIYWELK